MLLRKSPRALALLPLSIAAVLSTPAFAEARTPAADEPQSSVQSGQATSLDTVLVTGARTSTRTVKNSAVAIDVVAAEDLLATGKGNLLEALQYSLPSLSQNGGYQGDQENLIRGYQLRNLSPGYTLVLVNGKRRNASAYASASGFPGHSWTDLALIPVSAIDHVEVLRDGASAIYGSDAIAGVINVILKSAVQGGNVSIESGQSYDGDGDRTTVRGSIGLPWGDDGFVNIAAESSRQHHAIRAQPFRDDYLVYPGIDADGNPVNNSNVGSNGVVANPLEATRNNNAQIINSSPDYDLKSFALNAGRGLGESADFYATLTASDRDASAIQNFRTPNTVFINNPDALDIWPDGFSPVIQTKDRNYTGTAGVKGVTGEWDWDASVSYNRDTVRTYTNQTLNYDLDYPGSPTDFYDGQVDYRQTLVNLDVRRGFDVAAFATPLDFSIGAEYQHEQYQRSPGQPESYYDAGNGTGGASGFIGFAPEDSKSGNRNGKSLYAGLATNVTERWYVDLAARYEDHSDFGNVSTGRLSTRFDVNDVFGVRATLSNGFKSPGLATQYYQVTGNCPCATFFTPNVNSDVARALGAQPLQPEKSTNYSIGLTFDPTRNFHAALDVYQIEVRNRLYTSPSIGYYSLNYIAIPDGSGGALALDGSGNWINAGQQAVYNAALANAGLLAPETGGYLVSYFWNFGDTRTRGAELTLEATQDTRWGRLRYNYALSYSETAITKTNAAPQFLLDLQAALGLDLTAEPAYSLRHGAPAWTQVAGVNWRNGPWSLNLNLQHFGPQKQLSGSTQYEIDSSVLVGLSGSREFGKGWRVDVGVDNLTDETSQHQPDFVNAGSAYQWAYNTSDRVGTVGGYYYARLNYTF